MRHTTHTFRFLTLSVLVILAMLIVSQPSQAASRIKDIVSFEGVRDNVLIGYGLVVGLNGTGDRLQNSTFTESTLRAFLSRVGIGTLNQDIDSRNVAAVTVTATLPPFAREGSNMNVTVSTLGDARSLQGGMLLGTPLMGADGQVYAVAQGSILTEGFAAKGDSGSVSKGVPTNGFVPGGAIVEREIPFDFNALETMKLALINPDISTAIRIAGEINAYMEEEPADVLDPGTIQLTVPPSYRGNVPELIAQIEQLTVQPDQSAKVVIDEASGTIVMGENVKLDTVAIAQGNLVVRVGNNNDGQAANVEVGNAGNGNMALLPANANLMELVNGLNSLGIGPRDMISILQTIKVAGALHADVEAR